MKTPSKLRLIAYTLLTFIFAIGCASSQNSNKSESYENLVSIEKPDEGEPSQPSKVYIDSVKKITDNDTQALLISGTFPDACTKIRSVSHHTQNDSLHLDIEAWRNPEKMCAQVLTPFSYIYNRLSDDELSSYDNVTINNTAYNF